MKKIILLFLFIGLKAGFAQTFYQKLPTALNLDYDVAATEVITGYILGDNEVNSASNFHGVVRLIRTDHSGNIIWAKKYDAGSGISVHLLHMLTTYDNYILALGYIGPDNNSTASQKFVMKLDPLGNILWSKQYSSTLAYQENAIVQSDSAGYVFAMNVFSGGNYPVLCRIDTSGNVLSAAKFNLNNSSINSIITHNNSLDIILGGFYVLNTNLSGNVVNWQRQYNNTLQFNSLHSNRCENGDLIFIAGQIAGGFGDGTSRIFRTDSLGNLKWSKNVLAWRGLSSNSGTNFDVISQVAITESSIDSSIVGVSLEEGGTLLFSIFDSAGNFLYNRNHLAIGQQHCVTQTASGNYLVGSVFGFQDFSTFSSYSITPVNTCDSVLSISITTGVDSAAAMAPVTASIDTVTSINFTLTSTPINISPVVYCTPAVGIIETENIKTDFFIYPNPASDILHVQLDNLQTAQLKIINALSEVLLQKQIINGDNTINLSEIKDGIYFVTLTFDKHQISSRKLFVLKN
jgi:hypothetical protein